MALRYSTGFVHHLLGGATGKCLADIFKDCVIDVYQGTIPANADTGVVAGATVPRLLGTLTKNGLPASITTDPLVSAVFGLNFGDPVDRSIDKDSAEVWQFKAAEAGTAQWFRMRLPNEDGVDPSAVYPRIDGTIGTVFSDAILSSTNIVIDNVYTMNRFKLAWPNPA